MEIQSIATLILKLLFATAFIFYFKIKIIPFRFREKHSRRGRSLASKRELKKAEQAFKSKHSALIPFGGRWLPEVAATSHFLIQGTTGSGKTLTLNMIMNSEAGLRGIGVVPNRRALIYDAKQDVLGSLSRMDLKAEILTLNPFDSRGVAWDIAKDVTSPASALQIATNHIPKDSGSNSYFSDASRDLLYGLMLTLNEIAPGEWTYSDLIHAAGSRERILQILSKSSYGRDRIQSYISPDENDRTTRSVLSTLKSRMAPFECIAALWSRAERKISLRDWVQSDSILVLGNDESARMAIDAINQVIFQRLAELLLAQSECETRRTWLFLDEVAEAGRLLSLPRLMNKGRSKGVCVVLGVQELDSLSEVYGENGASVLVSNANHKALFRVESPKSAEWSSKMVGEYEEVENLHSVSRGDFSPVGQVQRSRSESRVRGNTVLPSEFLSLPPTNRVNGLSGVYISSFLGAYRTTLHPTQIDELLKLRGKTQKEQDSNFIPRKESDQYLKQWNSSDLKRLNFIQEKEKDLKTTQELSESHPILKERFPEELVH